MHTRRPIRRLFVGALAALLLVSAVASPAAATVKTASADVPLRVVDLANGDVWDSVAHMGARWDVGVLHEDGQTNWHFNYLLMNGAIDEFSECPFHFCTGGGASFSAYFLKSNGAVATYTYPANGTCGFNWYWPVTWKIYSRCRTNFDVPISVTQIKFNWLITESTATGTTIAWSKSLTVAI